MDSISMAQEKIRCVLLAGAADDLASSDLNSALEYLSMAKIVLMGEIKEAYSALCTFEDIAIYKTQIFEKVPDHLCQWCKGDIVVNALLHHGKSTDGVYHHSRELLAKYPEVDVEGGGSQRLGSDEA